VRDHFTIARGRLVDARGRGKVGTIWLFAAQPVPVGKTQTGTLIASGKTDSAGNFDLESSGAKLPPQAVYSRSSGWTNLDLLASDGRLIMYRSIARTLYASQTLSAFMGPHNSVDLGEFTLVQGARGVRRIAAVESPSDVGKSDPVIPCTETVTTVAETDRPTVVGELHTGPDASAKFTYGTTADSDVGTGVFDAIRGWSLAGETHVSTTSSSSVSWTQESNSDVELLTTFHFVKALHRSFGACQASFTTVDASAWDGGATTRPAPTDPTHRCSTAPYDEAPRREAFGARTTFSRDSKRAVTYSSAVTAFGIKLWASSGYSKDVNVQWRFGHGRLVHYLCGDSAAPGAAERIYAGG
jgi:hypothetical protein